MKPPFLAPGKQRGAVAVETAIAISLFVLLAIAVMEFGRLAYMWVAAGEAARLGARVAVVCDVGSAAPKKRMIGVLPVLKDSNIAIVYSSTHVAVTISNLSFKSAVPGKNLLDSDFESSSLTLELPPIRTSLPTESLNSTDNMICDTTS